MINLVDAASQNIKVSVQVLDDNKSFITAFARDFAIFLGIATHEGCLTSKILIYPLNLGVESV